jgi:hypothetical protein
MMIKIAFLNRKKSLTPSRKTWRQNRGRGVLRTADAWKSRTRGKRILRLRSRRRLGALFVGRARDNSHFFEFAADDNHSKRLELKVAEPDVFRFRKGFDVARSRGRTNIQRVFNLGGPLELSDGSSRSGRKTNAINISNR